jgi:hypothetical protein
VTPFSSSRPDQNLSRCERLRKIARLKRFQSKPNKHNALSDARVQHAGSPRAAAPALITRAVVSGLLERAVQTIGRRDDCAHGQICRASLSAKAKVQRPGTSKYTHTAPAALQSVLVSRFEANSQSRHAPCFPGCGHGGRPVRVAVTGERGQSELGELGEFPKCGRRENKNLKRSDVWFDDAP